MTNEKTACESRILNSRAPLNLVKMNVVEMLQKQFQDSATNLQTVQRDYSKVLADRQTLDSQLNENRQVRLTHPVSQISYILSTDT